MTRTRLVLNLTAVASLALAGTACVGTPSEQPSATSQDPAADPSTDSTDPTESSASEDASPSASATEPVAEEVNGTWCPSEDSPSGNSCFTLDVPSISYEDFDGEEEVQNLTVNDDGTISMDGLGGPIGVYYPAGLEIDLPDYYDGSDRVEQDRIWNSQTAVLALRD